jgi:hypothetical protein
VSDVVGTFATAAVTGAIAMHSASCPSCGAVVELDFQPVAGLVWCPTCQKMFSTATGSGAAPRNTERMGRPLAGEPECADLGQLRQGPIRHETLPPELLDQLKIVFDVIGRYLNMPLEQFEVGFMRDIHPESEVARWCSIAAAWLDYHKRFLGDETLPDDDERKLLGALLSISTGVDDLKMLGVPVEVGRSLIQCYDDLGRE